MTPWKLIVVGLVCFFSQAKAERIPSPQKAHQKRIPVSPAFVVLSQPDAFSIGTSRSKVGTPIPWLDLVIQEGLIEKLRKLPDLQPHPAFNFPPLHSLTSYPSVDAIAEIPSHLSDYRLANRILIPVVREPRFHRSMMYNDGRGTLAGKVELYWLVQGHLEAKPFLEKAFAYDLTPSPGKPYAVVLTEVRESLKRLFNSYELENAIESLPFEIPSMDGLDSAAVCSNTDKCYLSYFEGFTELSNGTGKVIQGSFLISADHVRDIEEISIPFRLGQFIPYRIEAWMLSPRGELVQIDSAQFHVEQDPNAHQQNMYDGRRYLMINLPRAVPGMQVFYSVTFHPNTSIEPSGTRNWLPLNQELGFDIDLPVLHPKGTWMVAMPTLQDTLYGQLTTGGIQQSQLALFPLYLHLIQGKRTETVAGIQSDVAQQLRISTTNRWDAVLGPIVDSIKTRLPPINPTREIDFNLEKEVSQTLAFLKDSVRYLSMAIGTRGFVPFFPKQLAKERAGDCKDFAVYFLDRMRRLGIPAHPALVSIGTFKDSSLSLPSHEAFDHLIVYLPDQHKWIDPTSTGVPFDNTPPWYLINQKAMVIFEDSLALITIRPPQSEPDSARIAYRCSIEDESIKCNVTHSFSAKGKERFYWALEAYGPELLSDSGATYYDSPNGTLLDSRIERIDSTVGKPLTVIRAFLSRNSVSRKMDRLLALHFPEAPLAGILNSVGAEEGGCEHATMRQRFALHVSIQFDNLNSIDWPKFPVFEQSPIHIFGQNDGTQLRIGFVVGEGELDPKSCREFHDTLEKIGAYFHRPIFAEIQPR